MTALRHFVRACPGLAALVLAAALLLRLAVPAGYMPAISDGRVTLALCPDAAPVPTTHAAMPGMAHHDAPNDEGHHPGDAPRGCAFADLSLPTLAGADPIQLAAAILYVMVAALFLRALPPRVVAPRLRPPTRAPPLPA